VPTSAPQAVLINPVSRGTAVTLTWKATKASYFMVSPQIGAIRGTITVVAPSPTTTYTLYATNQFGRAAATLTLTVQQFPLTLSTTHNS
jgi:hypothetical protein